ncbi:MAG: ABC transporter ATP-binding protein [Treponema sp.]|nr:ABC transporter ATP-binding protein [Treponema sp.]
MESILSYQGLSKIYGSKVALDGINLDIPENSIIGLLGPNGSGKTTLLKLAAGLLTPSTGKISSLGHKIGAVTKENIAYQPDRVFLNDWMTVLDLIHMMDDFFPNFNKNKALDLVKDLHINPKDRIKTLSKGNKEKVQLIMTMSRDVKLYLLDEPIGGVDPAAREYILKTILNNYKENSSIVISTHLILDIEEILTYIIFLKQGHIVRQGIAKDIRQESGMTIDQLFREEFRC